jgi:hypothetical protein
MNSTKIVTMPPDHNKRVHPWEQQMHNSQKLAAARRAKYKRQHPRNYNGKERHYAGHLGYF